MRCAAGSRLYSDSLVLVKAGTARSSARRFVRIGSQKRSAREQRVTECLTRRPAGETKCGMSTNGIVTR